MGLTMDAVPPTILSGAITSMNAHRDQGQDMHWMDRELHERLPTYVGDSVTAKQSHLTILEPWRNRMVQPGQLRPTIPAAERSPSSVPPGADQQDVAGLHSHAGHGFRGLHIRHTDRVVR